MIRLRTARPQEAAVLTALCLRSKAALGHDEAFMRRCRAELTLTAEDIASTHVQVAEIGGRIVGMAQMIVRDDVADLDKLFVEPDEWRSGIGRKLFTWATTEAARRGASVLTIDADPDAAGFYRRLGAEDDGTAPSGSVPGRRLPRLRLALAALGSPTPG